MVEFIRTQEMKESFRYLECVGTDATFKYLDKEQLKGDSWKDMDFDGLVKIMRHEIDECFEASITREFDGPTKMYNECLDVINMAKMVGARLKMEMDKK